MHSHGATESRKQYKTDTWTCRLHQGDFNLQTLDVTVYHTAILDNTLCVLMWFVQDGHILQWVARQQEQIGKRPFL